MTSTFADRKKKAEEEKASPAKKKILLLDDPKSDLVIGDVLRDGHAQHHFQGKLKVKLLFKCFQEIEKKESEDTAGSSVAGPVVKMEKLTLLFMDSTGAKIAARMWRAVAIRNNATLKYGKLYEISKWRIKIDNPIWSCLHVDKSLDYDKYSTIVEMADDAAFKEPSFTYKTIKDLQNSQTELWFDFVGYITVINLGSCDDSITMADDSTDATLTIGVSQLPDQMKGSSLEENMIVSLHGLKLLETGDTPRAKGFQDTIWFTNPDGTEATRIRDFMAA